MYALFISLRDTQVLVFLLSSCHMLNICINAIIQEEGRLCVSGMCGFWHEMRVSTSERKQNVLGA